MTQLLTHSRMACFRSCPRRHYMAYELGLRPTRDSFPLRVGAAFHVACETHDAGGDVDVALATMDDAYDLALVAAMFDGHRRRWADEPLEAVATEQPFEMPLVNPETGAPTPVWQLAGKIDRIVRLRDGRLALMERKTTSKDFSPDADYWVQLHMDQQLSIYVIAARALGYDVATVLYDVTRRPALRPLKATPEESRKYTKAGALYANQRDQDETAEEFAGRIAADIALRPEHYFARIEIARLDQDLEECAAELWIQQQTIRAMQRAGKWYRNPGSCFEPYSCEYLTICRASGLETYTPDGWIRIEDVHPELSIAVPTAAGG